MTLHKICNKIDENSQDWKKYCLWRNYNFSGFASLDSHLHKSIYRVNADSDWNFIVKNGQYLTDFISDYHYAVQCAKALKADEILNFDYLENEDSDKEVIGYDILDGNFSYSLLTNFGNDIKIVNRCLARNGLIRHRSQVMDVHKWFFNTMPDDSHVDGSRIFVVYNKSPQHNDASALVMNDFFVSKKSISPTK